ncbi:hypothetical protein L596_012112 [Steinernema carpocapsae]|uniref:F-box domain-containing protein n=1 Tax=Steinernema carpocapsae TaxID=34508 RepID=A0A4U5NWV6_STECR|nr:hypothetical protein L596_012112 [Steinernema carpocapsae]
MAQLSDDVLIKIIENCDVETVVEGTRTASSMLHDLSVKYGPKIELTLKIDDHFHPRRVSLFPRYTYEKSKVFSTKKCKNFGCVINPKGKELKELTLAEAEKELSEMPKFFVITEVRLRLTKRERSEKANELKTEELCNFASKHRKLFQVKDICIDQGDLQEEKQYMELVNLIRTFGARGGLNVDLKLNVSRSIEKFAHLYQSYNLHAKTLRLKIFNKDELDQMLNFLLTVMDSSFSNNSAIFLKVQYVISAQELFDKGNNFAKALSLRQCSNLQFLSIKAAEPEVAEFVDIEHQFHRFKKSPLVGFSVDHSYGVNIRLSQAFNTSKILFDDKLGLESGSEFECRIIAQKDLLLRLILLGTKDTIMGVQCKLKEGEAKTFVAKPRKRGADEPETGYCVPMALITFVEMGPESGIEEDWINLYSGVEMPETRIENCPFVIEAQNLYC